MNNDLLNWLEIARGGGDVERLHTVPTIREYKNSDHTYNAIILATEICVLNEMHPWRVVSRLIVHDIPEVYTGDIPAPMKRRHENFNDELTLAEQEWELKNVPKHYINNLSYREDLIVSFCDAAEFLLFCLEEIAMGNTHRRITSCVYRTSDYLEGKFFELEEDVAGLKEITISLMTKRIEVLERAGVYSYYLLEGGESIHGGISNVSE